MQQYKIKKLKTTKYFDNEIDTGDFEFEKFYSNLKEKYDQDELKKIEEEGKKERIQFITYSIIFLIGIMLSMITGLATIIVIVCFIKIAIIQFQGFAEKYKENYKQKIIKELLNSFGEEIEYLPKSGFLEKRYRYSGFGNYESYKSEDLMKIVLKDNTKMYLAEVCAKGDDSSESFHGMVVGVQLPKEYNKILLLRSDWKKSHKIQDFVGISFPKVELDSVKFEKNFDVYSTNRIFAMKVLTHNLMEELLRFEKDTNIHVELTINNDELFIRYFTGEVFDPPFNSESTLNKATLYRHYQILKFTFDFVYKMTEVLNNIEE